MSKKTVETRVGDTFLKGLGTFQIVSQGRESFERKVTSSSTNFSLCPFGCTSLSRPVSHFPGPLVEDVHGSFVTDRPLPAGSSVPSQSRIQVPRTGGPDASRFTTNGGRIRDNGSLRTGGTSGEVGVMGSVQKLLTNSLLRYYYTDPTY